MARPVTDFMAYNDIRAALGVSDVDLPDSTISAEPYAVTLSEELRAVSPSLLGTYEGIASLTPDLRSADEVRVFDLVRLFSVYALARAVGVALPMFALQSIGEGEASSARFSGAAYQHTLEKIESRYASTRLALRTAFSDFVAGPAPVRSYSFFLVSSPATDPVVG